MKLWPGHRYKDLISTRFGARKFNGVILWTGQRSERFDQRPDGASSGALKKGTAAAAVIHHQGSGILARSAFLSMALMWKDIRPHSSAPAVEGFGDAPC